MELEFRLREDAKRAKALTDENRLAILTALRQGEKCGCTLMSELNITQPTLSHHMRILCDSSLVSCVSKQLQFSLMPLCLRLPPMTLDSGAH